jgi:hypothetical protein
VPLLPSATVDSCTTDIWLVVSVPVLSEQMTVVQPSVSTDGSFLQSLMKGTGTGTCVILSPGPTQTGTRID